MTMSAHPALVHNADIRPMSYFPLSLPSWRDAVNAVGSERVSVVAEYDVWARSPSARIRLPSVVALRKYQRSEPRVAFTRFNVLLRDRFSGQYCGQYCDEAFAAWVLTCEHVIPRSRDGQTTWSNIVYGLRAVHHQEGKLDTHQAAAPKEPTSTNCWPPSARFRPAICTRVGRTASTGTRSSRPIFVS